MVIKKKADDNQKKAAGKKRQWKSKEVTGKKSAAEISHKESSPLLRYICPMNYWLVKSEPDVYSWEQFKKDGETQWTGVRNYAARLHLRAMKKGDEVLFYHSNIGLEIVGIAKVSKEAYPDPTADDDTWSAVDIKPFKALKKPVPLSLMKTDKSLKDMPLIRIGRLSVMPLTEAEYKRVMELAV